MPQTAATQFLRCARHPARTITDLQQQAFIASLIAGRSEAVQLARQLPDSQAAQLLLGQVGGARRPLAGRGAALPHAAAPGPDAAAAAAAGRLVAAGRRSNRRGAGDAASVPRRPAVPRRLRAARRADRRPGRPHGGRREAVPPGADRIRRHEPAPRADPGERAGAPRPPRRGAAHPRQAWPPMHRIWHRPAGADRRQHDPAGAARDGRDRRGLSRACGHPALAGCRRLRDAGAAPGARPAARLHRRAAAGGRHPGEPAPSRERPADAGPGRATTTR